MIALVTGETGFIGGALTDVLRASGAQVHGLCSTGVASDHTDICDAEAVKEVVACIRPEVVFHLAGVSGPMVAPTAPAHVTTVNCVGTVNVLEAARSAGVSRFVYASSVSGFDSGQADDPQPSTVYGATKRFGETVVGQYGRESDLTVTSTRIGSVFGAGRKTVDVLDRMLKQGRSGQSISYRKGAVVPLIHVSDCARYLAALGQLASPPPVCDLVTQMLSERALATMVAEALGLASREVAIQGGPSPTYPIEFAIGLASERTGLSPEHLLPDALKDMVKDLP